MISVGIGETNEGSSFGFSCNDHDVYALNVRMFC